MNSTATIQGVEIPSERFGHLADFPGSASDAALLKQHLNDHGYVLLRNVLDVDLVTAARSEVFGRLADQDEIADPPCDGIATGTSRRIDPASDGGAFWTSVNEGPALRRLTHGPGMMAIMESTLEEPARAFDLIYLRPTCVGKATAMHYDYPFFAGSVQPMFNAWIPIGKAPIQDGPMVLVEGSHRFDDLIAPFLAIDYAADRSDSVVQQAAYAGPGQSDPIRLVEDRDTRLLSADFRSGDLLIISMFMLHGSLDNVSPVNQVRLSCDVRYQPASQPADDGRYFGATPSGSKGGGYGDMRGAQPLA